MLQAQPGLNVISGPTRASRARTGGAADRAQTGKVLLVGYGASDAIAGVEFGCLVLATSPRRRPARGRLAVQALVTALRTGTEQRRRRPVAPLPNGGIVTKANAEPVHG